MGSRMNEVFFFVLVIFCGLFLVAHGAPLSTLFQNCGFDKIYQFGDSLSDTGNLVQENPIGFSNMPPYGETYFNKTTGRFSNGRLIIDYIASAAALGFLDPYEKKGADFAHGVNFAVAGSTALSVEDLALKNITGNTTTSSSLAVQLDWMSQYLSSNCTDTDCREKLEISLFIMGETGGNDYNYALFGNKNIEEVKSLVPEVVESIVNATRKIIEYGARKIVIPGNLPIGCLPSYLTIFQTDNSTFDDNFCLADYNDLAEYHNSHLKSAIEVLKEQYPEITFVYGNLYDAMLWLLTRAWTLGFNPTTVQKACCGTGGEYNFDFTKFCGLPGVPVCSNPDEYISWDGVHLTERSYMFMANWLIADILPGLECNKAF